MDKLDQNMYDLDYHYSSDDKYDVNNTDLISIKYLATPFAPSSNLFFLWSVYLPTWIVVW